ncbi:MAG TPA: SLC13 family permease [Candidatus Competibacteraceae bacterium]|nr:SLC13 family permease [Candidatus Competibacteraceae bacterium]
MTPDIAICLGILAAAVALFAWDRIPADVVALGVMLALIASGLLTPEQAFAGFASDTVMMILGLLIMTASLSHTGVVEMAGRTILDHAGSNPTRLVAVIMVSVAVVSAFISNTAATAFFLPVVLGFAHRTRVSASKYLLPLAFASILSSSVTLISTSTNIVVSELMTQHQLPEMGMFELAPVGIPIALAGLVYMWIIGVRLIPQREDQRPPVDIGHRKYQADVVVLPDSPLIGKTVAESRIGNHSGLSVVRILREGELPHPGHSQTSLQAGDHLVIEGLRSDILKVKDIPGVELKADAHLADPDVDPQELTIVEGVLMPQSPLIGRTLKSAEFKDRYGLQVLAINRAGAAIPRKMSTIPLKLGDVLLLQGTAESVKALERGNLFSIFGGVDPARLNIKRAPAAAAIFALTLIAAALKLVPLPVAVLSGAFLVLATRCISPEEAYRQVEWKALILIGALLSLGAAMESSGTGRFLAEQLIALTGAMQPRLLLAGFFLLTVVLTQAMSNQAAAIVILPIAIQTALQLDLNPRTFATMVAVAASCSYLTPLEPSCLMVYGPGKYRFADFFKVGLPLTLLIFAIAVWLVPWVWPL